MSNSLTPFVPPFTLELDDHDPALIADARQALAMAQAYLEDAPANTVAVLTDAAGRTWAMKTTDTGEVIEVPF